MTFHMTQIAHPEYNPGGDELSENCGPTSLAMGLGRLGLAPPPLPALPTGRTCAAWLSLDCRVQDRIDAARYAMFSDSLGRSLNTEKDGVEWIASGPSKALRKHQSLINLDDLRRGAANSGALAIPLTSLRDVGRALGHNHPVLLIGDPAASGAYGPRLGVYYRGGHVILAVAYEGGFRVHDPLCLTGPAWVSCAEISAFCGARIFGEQLGLALCAAS